MVQIVVFILKGGPRVEGGFPFVCFLALNVLNALRYYEGEMK